MRSESYFAFGSHNVLSVILGGGRGTRLFPLTQDRAKPAVPLGGKYRLVDIPISNCINSGLLRIYLLTQFNSASLHRHISQSYKFDHFSGGFVEILAAEQTLNDESWYQGTADAVRKNLIHFRSTHFDYMLILSGDQLYRMDYRAILSKHIATGAEITVATLPVKRSSVPGFGIMRMDKESRITSFVEKPKEQSVQDEYRLHPDQLPELGISDQDEYWLASMGIYVFNRAALFELLDEFHHDFGKEVIPIALNNRKVFGYVFQGTWEDIGTIRNFFDCSIDLTSPKPRFDLFDQTAKVYTRPRFLPSSRMDGAHVTRSLISDGCIIQEATIKQSVLGLRSVVGQGTTIECAILMGNDDYENPDSIAHCHKVGYPLMGIGNNTRIEHAIVDKNARVGDNCILSPGGKDKDVDHQLYFIRDGILIIPKNGVVPHGTVV